MSADPKDVISQITDLPTLPSVVARVNELVGSANASAGDINDVISSDIALSAKVLKMVNSSFYGFPRRITSITHAVVILGFNTVRNLVLSAFVFGAFKNSTRSFDHTAFWTHSLGVAVAGNQIAQHLNLAQNQKEDAFMAGLLHDVGKVVMSAFLPEKMEEVLKWTDENDMLFLDAEGECLTFNHALLGGGLLDQWNLPESIVALVYHHHDLTVEESDEQMVALLHLADILARALCIGNGGDHKIPQLNPEVYGRLGLTWDDVGLIMDKTLSEMQRTGAFLELM
ncbi:MAG: HDOD domain-containing protein [Planctomycetota bacterium]|jgi:putative nucleotidyltransferase with HDIG domain